MPGISIHALREEGDCFFKGTDAQLNSISIHALREEGDFLVPSAWRALREFLSTPSARRATWFEPAGHYIMIRFLSTPSARRATLAVLILPKLFGKFLSTPSARRATRPGAPTTRGTSYFYPRPPRGGRQQKQRENPLLLSHYTPPCTNCKEMLAKQTAKSHRYLRKRLVFRCEASRKTMCAAGSHWPGIKRSARCLGQTPGAVQRARPSSDSCCPAGRTADCPRQGRSGRSALL